MAAVGERVRRHVHDTDDDGLLERQLPALDRPDARRLGAGREHFAQLRRDPARAAGDERPGVARQDVDARPGPPMHEGLALVFGDVFEEENGRLNAGRGEPRRLCVPAASRERRAHRFRCLRGERGHFHLSALTTWRRAARKAGKNPPTIPMTTAKIIPTSSSAGVTRKLKAISLKLDQFVVLVTMPLSGSANRHPSTPPISAMNADSARKLSSTLPGLKPSVRSTPISGAREAIAAYIVLIAPNTAPTAMIPVIITARKLRIRPSSCDCCA